MGKKKERKKQTNKQTKKQRKKHRNKERKREGCYFNFSHQNVALNVVSENNIYNIYCFASAGHVEEALDVKSLQARKNGIKSIQELKVEKIIYFTKNSKDVAINACRTTALFKGKVVVAVICTQSTSICKLLNGSFSEKSFRKAQIGENRECARREATRPWILSR